jgi:signal transduction histidine kinase
MVDLAEEDLRVCDLAASALRLVRHRAEVGGVRLVEAIQDDLPLLSADPRRMKQILLNLLSNAVKFTPEGGEVHLKAEVRPDGWLEISVSDQGIGIAAHDIDRVLEPFTQADSSLSRRHEGTGLGLPLTRALVEMHGGRFTLQSELGEGTTARIELPAARLIHPEPEMTVPATA